MDTPAKIYFHKLSADSGCRLKDLLCVIDNWGGLGERFKEIWGVSTPL